MSCLEASLHQLLQLKDEGLKLIGKRTRTSEAGLIIIVKSTEVPEDDARCRKEENIALLYELHWLFQTSAPLQHAGVGMGGLVDSFGSVYIDCEDMFSHTYLFLLVQADTVKEVST